MKHIILTIVMATFLSFAARGLDVTTSAGRLHEAVGAETDANVLTVRGTLDASDFDFIRTKMERLAALDLSGVTIAAYDGEPLATGRRTSPEGELPEFALFGMKLTSVVLPPGLKTVGAASLAATSLTSIELPQTLQGVGDHAFSASELKEITVPAGVSVLGTGVFKDCTSLVRASLPQAEIPAGAFSGCTALTNVETAGKTVTVGDGAFRGCVALTDFGFGKDLAMIGDEAFARSGLKEAGLDQCDGLTYVGDRAFERCESLVSVRLPGSLAHMGESAFMGCSSAATVEAGEGLVSVGRFALAKVSAADGLDLAGTSVSEIGDYAMAGMTGVGALSLPATLVYIGDRAMEEMTSLKTIDATGLDMVPELGAEVWSGVDAPSVRLTVGAGVADDFRNAGQWREFDIVGSAGIDDVTAGASAPKVTARFAGRELTVRSTAEMAEVSLYDSSGRRQVMAEPGSSEITIDTSGLTCHIYIIKVTLADGTIRSLKLARR